MAAILAGDYTGAMLTLYGTQGSGSAAAELALERCGLAYRVVRASSWEADSAQDALRSANPLGQIPTLLLEDGSVLTESAAILIHLGLAHPASGLLPSEPAARAQAVSALVYIAANCYSAIGIIDYPERFIGAAGEPRADDATRERVRAGARRRLHECWDAFADRHATGAGPYLDGNEPGAVDYLAAVVSRWSGARAHLRQSRPGLLAALERTQSHPSATAVFARHWPASPA